MKTTENHIKNRKKLQNFINELQNIFESTNDESLLRFFTHRELEETWKTIDVGFFISILSKKKWEQRISNSTSEYQDILLMVARKGYKGLLPEFPSLEKMLWEIE